MQKYTKGKIRALQRKRLFKLIRHAGGVNHLSLMLDIPYTTVCGWEDRGRISKAGAEKVETHPAFKDTFTKSYLRPDLEKLETEKLQMKTRLLNL